MRSSVSHWLSSPFRLASVLTVVGLFLTLGMVACSDSVTPPASDPSSEESSEAPAEKDVFTEAENQPDCGGIRALSQNIQYPETAKAAGIEGRVFVEFVVDEAGNVTEPNIRKGAHKTLDETALAAVKQLQCEPGTVQGEPVKVKMTLPVTFKLPDDSSSKPSEELSSASAGLDEIVFHNLSEPQQDRILSGRTFSKETRSALNSDLSYPELIRRAGIEGTVKVTFTLGESGTPIRPRVTKSLHDALDAMALRSVQNTTFTTAETETVDLSGTKMSVRFAYRLPDRSS